MIKLILTLAIFAMGVCLLVLGFYVKRRSSSVMSVVGGMGAIFMGITTLVWWPPLDQARAKASSHVQILTDSAIVQIDQLESWCQESQPQIDPVECPPVLECPSCSPPPEPEPVQIVDTSLPCGRATLMHVGKGPEPSGCFALKCDDGSAVSRLHNAGVWQACPYYDAPPKKGEAYAVQDSDETFHCWFYRDNSWSSTSCSTGS